MAVIKGKPVADSITAAIKEKTEELKNKGVNNYHLQKYRPVPSDNESTETMCNKFFNDTELLNYLQNTFKVFDTRS